MAVLKIESAFRYMKSIALALAVSAACVAFAVAPSSGQSDTMPSKTIDLNLNNAPVRQALTVLFQGAGLNYTMDPGVSGFVTVSLRSVPFETALKAVLKSASPPLVAVKDPDTGVYYIKVKDESTVTGGNGNPTSPGATSPTMPGMGPGGGAASPAPYTPTATTTSSYQGISMPSWESLSLKFIDPNDLRVFSFANKDGTVVPMVIFQRTSSLAGAKTAGGMSFGGGAFTTGATTGGGGATAGGGGIGGRM